MCGAGDSKGLDVYLSVIIVRQLRDPIYEIDLDDSFYSEIEIDSEFGFSESIQRLCSSFDGPIVATGLNADSPMADRLRLLGDSLFAANAT